jgi:hypothetical protein
MAIDSRSHGEQATVRRQMSERVQALIAACARWLTASEVTSLASVHEENVVRWAEDAVLFSIERDGGAVFP